jgi:tetratricopeptide (TPR) repeat protein
MIHMVETGRSLPSLETLRLIASRVGKPLSLFTLKDRPPQAGASADPWQGDVDQLEVLCAQRDFGDVIRRARELLERPAMSEFAEASTRFYLGQALCRTYDHQEALEQLSQARNWYECAGDLWMVVECLDWEASAMFLGEDIGAIRAAEQALSRCEALEPVPPATHARILGHLAWMHVDRHDWRMALRYCEASIKASDGVRDLLQLAKSYSDMGLAYQELGFPERARSSMQKALHLYSLQSDLSAVYRCENNLAELLIREGDLGGAERHLQSALNGLDALRANRRSRGYVLNNLGEIALRRGAVIAAQTMAEEALGVARETDESIVEGGSEMLLARCAEASGRRAEADQHWRAALTTFERLEMANRLRDCHLEFARTLKARGDLLAAAEQWESAAELGKAISTGGSHRFEESIQIVVARPVGA